MRYRLLIVLVFSLVLAACSSGPGPGATGCDPCEAAAIAQPGAAGAAAAATGGQRSSQDPRATDTARISPNTVVGRGSGPTTSDVRSSEGRTVASGAGVTQGLQVPTSALAQAGARAVPQVVQQIRSDIAAMQADARAILDDARCARAAGDPDAANALMQEYRELVRTISAMQDRLAVAESGSASRVYMIYNQQGQRVVQSVVSGTDAAPTPQSISEDGAASAAQALSNGARSVMEAPDSKAVEIPGTVPAELKPALATDASPSASPASDELPDAPAVPPVPTIPPTSGGSDG